MPEFVNPKYTDGTKTKFKSPTRLECMMQDYPKSLGPQARPYAFCTCIYICKYFARLSQVAGPTGASAAYTHYTYVISFLHFYFETNLPLPPMLYSETSHSTEANTTPLLPRRASTSL